MQQPPQLAPDSERTGMKEYCAAAVHGDVVLAHHTRVHARVRAPAPTPCAPLRVPLCLAAQAWLLKLGCSAALMLQARWPRRRPHRKFSRNRVTAAAANSAANEAANSSSFLKALAAANPFAIRGALESAGHHGQLSDVLNALRALPTALSIADSDTASTSFAAWAATTWRSRNSSSSRSLGGTLMGWRSLRAWRLWHWALACSSSSSISSPA